MFSGEAKEVRSTVRSTSCWPIREFETADSARRSSSIPARSSSERPAVLRAPSTSSNMPEAANPAPVTQVTLVMSVTSTSATAIKT